jgi:AcrR family transcriptional regulator
MPVTAADRLLDIASAGARCFGRLGYRRTRMAEVAVEAGVSTGSVYTYVESKEALLHLVLAAGLGRSVKEFAELPVADPGLDATVDMVGRELRRLAVTPGLKTASEQEAPLDMAAELESVIAEQYSTIERVRRVLSVIEACAADVPALEALYFGRARRGRIDLLTRYLQRRADSGHLARFPDMAVAAQIVTESVAWFGWKRLEGRDANRFDDDLARHTVVEFMCQALLPRATNQ